MSIFSSKDLIEKNLDKNIKYIKELFGDAVDLVIRKFKICDNESIETAVIYIDGLIDKKVLNDDIIKPIMIGLINQNKDKVSKIYDNIKLLGITSGEIQECISYNNILNSLFIGDSVLLIDGIKKGLIIGTKGWKDREVGYPENEPTNVGPQDSFTENVRTNTALVRRRIKHENLRYDSVKVGNYTKTEVTVAYIKELASDDIVNEVKKRLNKIKTEGVIDSTYILRALKDKKIEILPTIFSSQKPDYISTKLLEGRVAVFVDGSPFVIFVPVFFTDMFISPSDYYHVTGIQYFLMILRFFAFIISIMLPGFYIALTCYHTGIIPTPLQIKLISDYSQIVFPIPLEVIILLIFFEFLREASFRMPTKTSSSILFVGGLVISQSIVEARLASSIVIIVVALTILTSYVFVETTISTSLRNMRIFIILLASTLGFYGLGIGTFFLTSHVSTLTSLKSTYLSNKYRSHGPRLQKKG